MTHLTPDELIDAVENVLAPQRRAHLNACARCGAEHAALERTWNEARAVTVPEPSPLYWDHLSRRVREAVDGEAVARHIPSGRERWYDWRVLAPVAVWVLFVATLASVVPESTSVLSRATGVPESVEERRLDVLDARWAVMLDTVGEFDVETALDEGLLGHPWSADGAILQLTSAEQQELVRLLNEELR